MPIASLPPLPIRWLPWTRTLDELVPRWLGEADLPWLRDLLFEAEALVGRPRTELLVRWRRNEPDPRAGRGLWPARHALLALLRPPPAARDHADRRRDLFAAAAAGQSRRQALARTAARHGITPATLLADLFADLPHARPLLWPEPAPTPGTLRLAANRCLAAGLLVHAEDAELRLVGGARAVLRTAWLRGLGLVAAPGPGGAATFHWRRGSRGARAARDLAALVPLLPWTRQFELRARCRLPGAVGTFVLSHHDAILPGPEPRPFDSALERRFALDFAALAPDWELLREPAPLVHGDQFVFPDFLARPRGAAGGCLLEVAGLRDPLALPARLALLQREPRYLLCLPRRHLPPGVEHDRIVAFGRRVPAAAVRQRLERILAADHGDAPPTAPARG
ncbi:MAG: DUF790 family protein [Planctomycetes bacterium]|nr:DUF790 family protein [Planctomycetota bacterium]